VLVNRQCHESAASARHDLSVGAPQAVHIIKTSRFRGHPASRSPGGAVRVQSVLCDCGDWVLAWGFIALRLRWGRSVRGYGDYVPSRLSGMGLPRSSKTRRCSRVGVVNISRRFPAKLTVALLPRCALLVSHGGFNSAKEALAVGVPLVIVPIAGDQPYCARRCQALGVGRVIWPAERNAAAIRAAVRTVLGDPAYREHAQHMRDEAGALPPAAAAVTVLEQVADEHAGGLGGSMRHGYSA
jgi:Erythromycin biosynthesis protein CIII-like, C-terminal domain